MPTVRRFTDLFFSAFFALHVIITICVDAQVVLPAHIYPLPLRSLLSWYISYSGDYFVRDAPPFFKGLVVAELFFQLPLIIVNAYGFCYGRRWARTTGLIYGVHTATTLVCFNFVLFCMPL
ncbi:hypothetical protein L7F22_016968 [Adiantum nelumboides]|nr:hypothetical protein [Adiantum nelumboides]